MRKLTTKRTLVYHETRSLLMTALVVGGIGSIQTATANLLINGGFEQPPVTTSNGWLTFLSGSTIGSGWIVDANSVDVHVREFTTPWTVVEGSQALDLTGGDQGIIHQDVPVVPGMTYTLSYYQSANLAFPPTITSLSVYADGDLLGVTSFDRTGATFSDMHWEEHTFSFVAPDDNLRLTFESETPGCCGPAIDDVRLEQIPPVPESTRTWLIGVGLLGTLGIWRIRR